MAQRGQNMYKVNCGQLRVISPTSVFVSLMTKINKGRITKKMVKKYFQAKPSSNSKYRYLPPHMLLKFP